MNIDMERLLQFSSDAVIGIKDGGICFANSAARDLYDISSPQKMPYGLIPQCILSCQGEYFAGSAYIAGTRSMVNALRGSDGSLYLFIRPGSGSASESSFVSDSFLANAMTILGSLGINIDLLLSGKPGSISKAAVKRRAAALSHSYHKLRRLLCNLNGAYEFSRGGSLFIPQNTDLVSFCSRIAEHASAAGDSYNVVFSTGLSQLCADVDRGKLERLLLNLISNSFNSYESGGKITILLRRTGDSAVISVCDSGCGISPDMFPTLFCRYRYSAISSLTSMPRSGLGLYVSRGIAELHSGSIIIESKLHAGTKAHVFLPLENGSGLFRESEESYASKAPALFLTELSEHLCDELYEPASQQKGQE